MSEGQPLISIGMAVRNCEKTVAAAVESILQGTYANWELIVIDDGSSDDTLEMVRAFPDPRIRLYTHARGRGLAIRLNEAIELSRGEYFARMDGDDICYPHRLAVQLAYLQQHPDVDLVGARVVVFDMCGSVKGKRLFPELHAEIGAAPWAGFAMAHPTFMARRDWFARHRYRENQVTVEDQELLARTFGRSVFANVPEILLGYREGEFRLRTRLSRRWYLLQALVRESAARREIAPAARSVSTQVAKMAVDSLAAFAGRKSWLSRRSMQAVSESEASDWGSVWASATRNERSGDE